MQVLVLKFIKDYTLDTYEIGCLELHRKVTTFGLISTWFFVVINRRKDRGFAGAGRPGCETKFFKLKIKTCIFLEV